MTPEGDWIKYKQTYGLVKPVGESNNIGRRLLLIGIIGTAVTAVADQVTGGRILSQAERMLLMTDAQRQAVDKFNNTPKNQRIHNLIVRKEMAKLRDIPNSMTDSHVVGTYELGTVVSEAIRVTGNNPSSPGDHSMKGIWYFIPSRFDKQGQAKSGVFSYSGNFQP